MSVLPYKVCVTVQERRVGPFEVGLQEQTPKYIKPHWQGTILSDLLKTLTKTLSSDIDLSNAERILLETICKGATGSIYLKCTKYCIMKGLIGSYIMC